MTVFYTSGFNSGFQLLGWKEEYRRHWMEYGAIAYGEHITDINPHLHNPLFPDQHSQRSDGRKGEHYAQKGAHIGDIPKVALSLSDRYYFIPGKRGVTLRRRAHQP